MAAELQAAIIAEDAPVARIVVAGHVDHGKSTMIGRLMYDLGALHESKIADVLAASARRGVAPEWSYVLDSLQEERDQAITIDTTRLWFSHEGRRFVIIDAPGHRQFLANMLSGASEADAAILVVDAATGIEDQTLRHAYLLGFLGIEHVVVAVNKIDLVDDPRVRFADLAATIGDALRGAPAAIVPISARNGDNVVVRADSTPWYDGPTVAEALAAVRRTTPALGRALRVAVQDVYRRDGERVAVGTIASGSLAVGDPLTLLPAGELVRVQRLVRWPDSDVRYAAAGETIGIVLDGDRFIGRGDTLADSTAPPKVSREIAVEMFWLDERAPHAGQHLRIRRGSQDVPVVVTGSPSIYDIEAASNGDGTRAQHGIVRLTVRAAAPVAFDRRDDDAAGARSVLLAGDRVVAIGFTVEALAEHDQVRGPLTLAEREARAGHRAGIVWLTGLSAAGKTTIAREAERRLFARGINATVVDGDILRSTLNTDLGFSTEDRAESVRRAAAVAGVLADAGHVVLVTLIAPFAVDRAAARETARHPFCEVYVNAPLDVCEARDPKGLYRRARSGELQTFTGIDSPYEPPQHPDLELRSAELTLEESVTRLVGFVLEQFA